MKAIYDRIRYLIEDITVKIQQIEVNDIIVPLKGHSEWLDGIYRDIKGKIDPQLKSLLVIYIDRLGQYNDLLKRKKSDVNGVLEARDNTMKVLRAYEIVLRK